jgi:Fe2+ transport system protein B
MSDTIAQIQANLLEEDLSEESENTPLPNSQEEEEKQLDQAVATLDPIKEIKERKKQEEEEVKRLAQQKKEGIHNAQTVIRASTDTFKSAQEQVFDTADKIRDTAGGFWDSIGRVAVPGSIWLPIAILLIFFFLLLPVNGQTRAQWLFLSLTGQAHVDTGGNGAGGAGGFTGVSNL